MNILILLGFQCLKKWLIILVKILYIVQMNFRTVILYFVDYGVFLSYLKDKKAHHFLKSCTKEDMVVNFSLITSFFKKKNFANIWEQWNLIVFMVVKELKMFLEALKYLSLKMDEKEYN